MDRRLFIKNTALIGVGSQLKLESWISSPYYKIALSDVAPAFDFFSVDSLGKSELSANTILKAAPKASPDWILKGVKGGKAYVSTAEPKNNIWTIKEEQKSFSVTSTFDQNLSLPFELNFSQAANHVTLLGIMDDKKNEVKLPAVLHFPDMGTLRITCSKKSKRVLYYADRKVKEAFVKLHLPAATSDDKSIEYKFEVVSIYPNVKGIKEGKAFDAFRKNFISILQLNPGLGVLANNSSSDNCGFILYKYSDIARYAPPLAEGLHASDLVRMSLDRYLAGQKGYGMRGYQFDSDIGNGFACDSLDTYPSLLISACNYVIGTGDIKWFEKNYEKLLAWHDHAEAMDTDHDGLIEYCQSGNSGSWKGDRFMRPANWWDTIGFGHKDAYSNALYYHALMLFAEANRLRNSESEAKKFADRAEKLKSVYVSTFLNPDTGILAGWKSADGVLHDYYFTFVNGIAITYGLVDHELGTKIMEILLAKMKSAGFTNFGLGLPGNLIPVKRADYAHHEKRWGGGDKEDNSDGFQIYENGGATACYTYFTIRALQLLNKNEEANKILLAILKSMGEGNFQGTCENGMSRDWKTWSGECWGYEGFLADNYHVMLAGLSS